MTERIPTCGAESEYPSCRPCAREPGHDGDHAFWRADRIEGGRKIALWIYGDDGKATAHFDLKGGELPGQQDAAALIQYLDHWRKERLRQRWEDAQA